MGEWIPLGISVAALAAVWFAVGRIRPGDGKPPQPGPDRNARGDSSSGGGGFGFGGGE